MARYDGSRHRVAVEPRGSNVKGDLCPGMYVEDPRKTLVRNIHRLIERMKKEELSQAEFCRRAGVGYNTWKYLRDGKSWPDPGTLQKIASAAGVPVEVLFRR